MPITLSGPASARARLAHNPQQRIVAHRKHQPPGRRRPLAAAKRQAEMMDESFETARRRERMAERFLESFGEISVLGSWEMCQQKRLVTTRRRTQ